MVVIIGNGGHARDIQALTGHPMIPHHSEWDGHSPYIIGINDPQVRAKVAAELGGPGWSRGRFVHPTAYLGCGTTHGSSFIGDGTHINYGAMMTRTDLGEYVTICPGAHISGDVTIGDRVLIGTGAVIAVPHAGCHITIGDDAVVGAGAVVLHDIPEGTWVGNPARRVK